ncbi:MAG: nuclear transport factor 2 family protein [Micropepsaceae bacterium]
MRIGSFGAVAFLAIFIFMGTIVTPASATSQPAVQSPDAVAEAMRDMYAALTTDDTARLKTIFTEDFYAFDGGRRFDRETLARLIIDAHKAGKSFVWNVIETDVHIQGAWAWIAYVNKGSVSDASGVKPVTWLESAVLRFEDGRWRIAFFHSTRMPPAA